MRKAKKGSGKHSPTTMTATVNIDELFFLEELVEELAHRRYDVGYSLQEVPGDREAIDTSSLEAHISGNVVVAENNQPFRLPFMTSFVFTCCKVKNSDYQLCWMSSLN